MGVGAGGLVASGRGFGGICTLVLLCKGPFTYVFKISHFHYYKDDSTPAHIV